MQAKRCAYCGVAGLAWFNVRSCMAAPGKGCARDKACLCPILGRFDWNFLRGGAWADARSCFPRSENPAMTYLTQQDGGKSNPSLEAGEGESRAHRGIPSLLRLPSATISLRLRRWYCNSALPLLFAEIHGLGHRIQRVLEIREVELRRGKEEVRAWMDDCLVGEPYKHDYIRYMQQTTARNPFLSIFDRLLLTHAWKSGLESRGLSRKSQNQVDNSSIIPAGKDSTNERQD